MALLLLFAWPASQAHAQAAFTAGNLTYSQDFDTLPASAQVDWADNSTLAAWYQNRTGNGILLIPNDGSSNSGALRSYGTGADTDRALGSLGSGNAAVGDLSWGVRMVNNTGAPIASLDITYTLEQWRDGANAAQTVRFFYRLNAGVFDLATQIAAADPPADWTAEANLNGTSPITTGAQAALDGNAAPNRVVVSYTLTVAIADGDEIWLGWYDEDHPSFDHGFGIDDLTITANSAVVGTPPTLGVMINGVTINDGDTVIALLGVGLADAFDIDITIGDDTNNVTLDATVTNLGSTGINETEFRQPAPQAVPYNHPSPISGTCNAVGTHVVTLTAEDADSQQVVLTFTIKVVTPLDTGDVAIIGFRSDDPDGFAFVAIGAIPADTEIRFTDDSHDGSNFRGLEDTLIWTAPAGGVAKGAVVIISNGGTTASAGTVSGSLGNLTDTAGDQIFAYQGNRASASASVLLFGINFGGNGGWATGGAASDAISYLPSTLSAAGAHVDLTIGSTNDNGQYTGSREDQYAMADYLTPITDVANWSFDPATITFVTTSFSELPPGSVGLGSGSCAMSADPAAATSGKLLGGLLGLFVLALLQWRRRTHRLAA
ncbi:MAG: hypothetical protein AB7K09_06705 [Planctomycetota bacterium]